MKEKAGKVITPLFSRGQQGLGSGGNFASGQSLMLFFLLNLKILMHFQVLKFQPLLMFLLREDFGYLNALSTREIGSAFTFMLQLPSFLIGFRR